MSNNALIAQADRMVNAPLSKIREVIAYAGKLGAQRKRIVHLEIGEPDFAFSRSASFGFADGLGNIQEYFNKTNEYTLLLPQCETKGALESIEEIVALDGIDGIFVGPYDLSVALGMPAQFDAPAFRQALERVLNACKSHGKLAFLYANSMAEARRSFEQGYQGAAIGVDTAFLVAGIKRMLNE